METLYSNPSYLGNLYLPSARRLPKAGIFDLQSLSFRKRSAASRQPQNPFANSTEIDEERGAIDRHAPVDLVESASRKGTDYFRR
ncbi:MAG: hypothetical protein WCQ50_15165 [Spirochaetota bacterium]